MDDQLVNKYLRGEASEKEVASLFQWIEAAPENRKEFIRYKKIKALTSSDNGDESLAWEQTFAPRFRKQKLIKLYVQVAKYAAIFLLVFGTGMSIQYFGWQSQSESAADTAASSNSRLWICTRSHQQHGRQVDGAETGAGGRRSDDTWFRGQCVRRRGGPGSRR